jgi:UDP-N-acetylmuramoyl-tripeptide--D-alanyl-D-alanine ligase
MLRLGDVLSALAGREVLAPDHILTDAVIDSRLAIPGALFVALKGENVDGHDFIKEAFGRGASLALIEREVAMDAVVLDLRGTLPDPLPAVSIPMCLRVESSLGALQRIARYWRKKLSIRVIGVTGSVGKSTTKELIADVLDQRYSTIRSPGNLNNEIGLPLTLLKLTRAHERAVLEMGFYVPGEITLLCNLARPQVGVVTNVSQVHLERAGSLEAIARGKAELVKSLPPAPEGVAILNFDDEYVRPMAELTQASVFYYGLTPEADLWATEIEGLGLEGVRFLLHYRGDSVHMRVPLLGQHSVHTALRAAAVGLVEELTWQEIAGGLQESQSQLRLVAVQGPRGSLILDDTYNAAPPSVIAALNLLGELEGRRVAVLGDMLELGEYSERGHRLVGGRAAEIAEELVVIGERARWIADEAIRSGMPSSRVKTCESNEAAAEYLRERVREGDVILIKGSRGMRMDHIVDALEKSA